MSSGEFEKAVVEGLQKSERALTMIEEHEKHCAERYQGILSTVQRIDKRIGDFFTVVGASMIATIGFLIIKALF